MCSRSRKSGQTGAITPVFPLIIIIKRVLLTGAPGALVKESINRIFCVGNINCHFLLSNNYIAF